MLNVDQQDDCAIVDLEITRIASAPAESTQQSLLARISDSIRGVEPVHAGLSKQIRAWSLCTWWLASVDLHNLASGERLTVLIEGFRPFVLPTGRIRSLQPSR